MIALAEVHLVRRLPTECGVRKSTVVLLDVEIDEAAKRAYGVKVVLHHDSIIELEHAISVCARTRRRAPEFTSSSMALVLFSTPLSANSVGGLSVDTVELPASSKMARVFVGSKFSETRHARILREKLSITA